MGDVGRVRSSILCRQLGDPEFYPKCNEKPLVGFEQRCKVERLLQWIKKHSGRCVGRSVTMDTRTIGPLRFRLALEVDFPESGLGFAPHYWDASEQWDTRWRAGLGCLICD